MRLANKLAAIFFFIMLPMFFAVTTVRAATKFNLITALGLKKHVLGEVSATRLAMQVSTTPTPVVLAYETEKETETEQDSVSESLAYTPEENRDIEPDSIEEDLKLSVTPTPASAASDNVNIKPEPTSVPEPVSPSLTDTKDKSSVKSTEDKLPATGSDEDIKNYLMNEINAYRTSLGLPEVKTDQNTCSFAKTRAQELSGGFSHDGFTSRLNSKSLPYPSFSMVTENIAVNYDYKRVVPNWIASPGHAENMRKDTPFVCVEKYSDNYAYEGWKP